MTQIKATHLASFAVLASGMLIALSAALGREEPRGNIWDQQIQDAYAKHLTKVRAALPARSALPPTLDLSKSTPSEDGKDLAWEYRWKGWNRLFNGGKLTDPGVPNPTGATSIATTFLDGGYIYDLPARDCDAVVIGKPIASEARIDQGRSFVYARFSLEISQVLKGNRKRGIREGATIAAVEFGGSVRFPSGHVETFILASNGFLELGKQYLIFVWKPQRSVNTYIVAEPYLIQSDRVFPINRIPDEPTYDGMPFDKFEARVKSAIAKNVDTN